MVALNVHCVLLEVPAMRPMRADLSVTANELLPWADPYICKLVAKLKAEILAERAAERRAAGSNRAPRNEAAPPLPGNPVQFDRFERGVWPDFDE